MSRGATPRRAITALAIAGVVACKGGADGTTAPPGSIGLALAAASLSVAQGQSGTVGVTVSGGRSGSVTFTRTVDRTIPLGPFLTPGTVTTLATSPYIRFRMVAPWPAAYSSYMSAFLTETNVTSTTFIEVRATPAYFGAPYDVFSGGARRPGVVDREHSRAGRCVGRAE